MEKAVSVIVPVYNGEKCVLRSVESILNQTLADIEVIVVNDGSTDCTEAVLHSIHDTRLKIITQENMGQGFARNNGLLKAQGKYVAFVDADDTIDENMLYAMYNRAEKDKSQIVQCNLLDVYPDGHTKIQLNPADETVTLTDKGEYTDKYVTPCRHSYEVCNKLFLRSFLEKSGVKFRDTKKYFAEDLMFNLELIKYLDKISFVPDAYYNYIQHPDSHFHDTKNSEKRLLSFLSLFETYMTSADSEMRGAASYTASMIILYNAGLCEKHAAIDVLKSPELRGYIKAALKRKCSVKHRLFLTAVYILPPKLRFSAVKMYAGKYR